MSEKLPQPTEVLIKRLRRVAKYHDALADDTRRKEDDTVGHCVVDGYPAQCRARANTCWQSAARLEELLASLRKRETSDAGAPKR